MQNDFTGILGFKEVHRHDGKKQLKGIKIKCISRKLSLSHISGISLVFIHTPATFICNDLFVPPGGDIALHCKASTVCL